MPEPELQKQAAIVSLHLIFCPSSNSVSELYHAAGQDAGRRGTRVWTVWEWVSIFYTLEHHGTMPTYSPQHFT